MKFIWWILLLPCVVCVQYDLCNTTTLAFRDLERITYSLYDLSKVSYNTTGLISDYFPSSNINDWVCENTGSMRTYYGQAFYAITFQVDTNINAPLRFLIQPVVYSNSSYVIYGKYVVRSGNNYDFVLQICFWNYFNFSFNVEPPKPISCAFNRTWSFGLEYKLKLGVVWRYNYVKFITPQFIQEVELDKAYWEIIRVSTGRWSVGAIKRSVATQVVDKRSTFLVNFNQTGYATQFLNCSSSIEAQLKCNSRSFDLKSGVYEIAAEEKAEMFYTVVTNVTTPCEQISNLFNNFSKTQGNGIYAGSFASMSCIVPFNFSISNDLLKSNLQLRGPNGEFKPFINCKSINPIGLFGNNGSCYAGMEWSYWTREFAGDDIQFEGVAESYYNGGLDENECYGLIKSETKIVKGHKTDVLYYKIRFMNKGLDVCYGNLPPPPEVNKCNIWTFNDITFEGVLLYSNKTFNPQLNVLYKGSMVVMIRVFGIVYEVIPCVKTRVSVIYNANNNNYSTLHRVANCDQLYMRNIMPAGLLSKNGINTPCGCLRDAIFSPNMTVDSYSCKTVLSNGYCVVFNNESTEVVPIGIVGVNTTYLAPILEESYVEIALDHVLISESEYYQTEMPVFEIDCYKYICDNSESCMQLLEQYAGFCSKVTSDVKGNSQILNANTLAMYKSIVPSDTIKPIEEFGDFNMSMFNDKSGRSVLEDLLFDKIVTSGPGFYDDYYKCRTHTVKDLVCAQYYNGIMVVPPIQDAATMGMYGGIVAASMSLGLFGGQLSMATWQVAMSARLNAVGVSQGLIMEDVKKLADGFNSIAQSVSKMASVTADALNRIQGVVNANALQVELLAKATMDNFGAISSNFEIIEKRLKQVQAEQQMDRVINGKMNALLNFVSNYKLKVAELSNSQQLVKQKVQECVQAQSVRNGFCGSGLHVMSIPQLVPNGVMFLHFSLVKNSSIIVQQTPGLCFKDKFNCIVPKSGIFVSKNNSQWYITPRNKFVPKNITVSDVVYTTYSKNFTIVNNTIHFPGIEFPENGDFDSQIKNVTLELEELKNVVANMSFIDLSNHTLLLKNISEEVAKMNITVSQFKQYVQYVKWPWYVWLLIVMALIAFGLLCFWLFMMTGCCGLCDCIRRSCCDSNTYEPIEKIHIQ